MRANPYYKQLKNDYLFAEVERRASAWQAAHPQTPLVRLGIGDVTQPLCAAAAEAGRQAAAALATRAGFCGYGPYEGYAFLRERIAGYYGSRGVGVDADEIFVTDGAKSTIAAMLDLFSRRASVLLPTPVYPVYVDVNVLQGRHVKLIKADRENSFLPLPPKNAHADVVLLCSPNNPTGAAYSAAQLKLWVDYAKAHGAVLLFDAAYEAFVRGKEKARSIYEVPDAKDVAIEIGSFSKTAGFTGVRCGYAIVPKALELHAMWRRRIATATNGVSVVVQRMAEAALDVAGLAQCAVQRQIYAENAATITCALQAAGVYYTGGTHAPYVWMRCGGSSWEAFDRFLSCGVVATPGIGFGLAGEGYMRLTAFGTRADTKEAMRRLRAIL